MPPHLSPSKPAPVHLSRSELKVMLADDDSFQLELISEALKSLGIVDITLAASKLA